MPKSDSHGPKAIANRQKAKGLQRLRWYCQMCEKQCRDENGFKCHMSSEGHLRMMRVFAENPNHMLDQFSKEFEKTFLQILSHRHGTKRVSANRIYQELIADKSHIHMNATTWTTLTGFCMYLGREGKAIVDETEKGWHVQYIERDPKVLERQAQQEARRQLDLDEEERNKRMIDEQVSAAEEKLRQRDAERQAAAEEEARLKELAAPANSANSLIGEAPVVEESKPVALSLSFGANNKNKKRKVAAFAADDDEDDTAKVVADAEAAKRAKNVGIEKLMVQEQIRHQHQQRPAMFE